jgi:F-type H+-transporting ATPase subunit b
MTDAARRILLALILGGCLFGPSTALGRRSSYLETRSLDSRLGLAKATEGAEEGKAEGHELIFKIINFALLAGGLIFLLRKPAAEFFAQRSASIKKSLDEGRKALEASRAQLDAVEEKLRHLEEEIAAFKASAAKEMEAERQRWQQGAAEEAERILASARAQMETSTRAAILELRTYAAQQALALAEEMIRQRLDDAGRQRLVSRFISRVESR